MKQTLTFLMALFCFGCHEQSQVGDKKSTTNSSISYTSDGGTLMLINDNDKTSKPTEPFKISGSNNGREIPYPYLTFSDHEGNTKPKALSPLRYYVASSGVYHSYNKCNEEHNYFEHVDSCESDPIYLFDPSTEKIDYENERVVDINK